MGDFFKKVLIVILITVGLFIVLPSLILIVLPNIPGVFEFGIDKFYAVDFVEDGIILYEGERYKESDFIYVEHESEKDVIFSWGNVIFPSSFYAEDKEDALFLYDNYGVSYIREDYDYKKDTFRIKNTDLEFPVTELLELEEADESLYEDYKKKYEIGIILESSENKRLKCRFSVFYHNPTDELYLYLHKAEEESCVLKVSENIKNELTKAGVFDVYSENGYTISYNGIKYIDRNEYFNIYQKWTKTDKYNYLPEYNDTELVLDSRFDLTAYAETKDNPLYLSIGRGDIAYLRENYDYKNDEFVIRGTEVSFPLANLLLSEKKNPEINPYIEGLEKSEIIISSKNYERIVCPLIIYEYNGKTYASKVGYVYYFTWELTEEQEELLKLSNLLH